MVLKKRLCVVPSCKWDQRSNAGTSYHQFPARKLHTAVRTKWTNIIRELRFDPNWEPHTGKICSRHFKQSDFIIKAAGGQSLLQSFAIPSQNLNIDSIVESEVGMEVDEMEEQISKIFVKGQLQDNSLESKQGLRVELTIRVVKDETNGSTSLREMQSICMVDNDGKFETEAEAVKIQPLFPGVPTTPKSVRNPKLARKLFENPSLSPVLPYKLLTPKSKARAYLEHNYAKSPSSTSRYYTNRAVKLQIKLRNMKISNLKSRQKLKKIHTRLSDKLKTCKHLESNHFAVLQSKFPTLLNGFIQQELQASKCKTKYGIRYTEEMRKFSNTLHFMSPKAYRFLRNYLTLPHESTLSSWTASADCSPGFCKEVIAQLTKARVSDNKNMMTDVVLQVDEMAIRKDTVWSPNQHRYVGYVTPSNKWTGSTSAYEDGAVLASSTLVVLLAGISGGWKCPIGYIFTDKVDGSTMFSMVTHALKLLGESGFKVHALISDGFAANVTMFEKFGMREKPITTARKNLELVPIRYGDIQNVLTNPYDKGQPFCAMFDMCHEMKLWRNLLSQCSGIQDEEGSSVEWHYITRLHDLQISEGIRAGNKLGKNHIEFQKHKMRVRLAVQVLSSSVADAIDFCQQINEDGFENSGATSRFIRDLDKVFDILNSSNPTVKGYKHPLNKENIVERTAFLKDFCERILKYTYLESRKTKSGMKYTRKLICRGNRHRPVLGTVMTIKSIIQVSFLLLNRDVSPFKYILTYRFSQDLLELFFNKVRGRLGRNNNPNVIEFQNIMKNCWHQNMLKSSNTGNCITQMNEDNIPGGLLPLMPRVRKIRNDAYYDAIEFESLQCNDIEFSQFYINSLAYIAGNVSKVLGEKLKCETCKSALISSPSDTLDKSAQLLIQQKTSGGLLFPSQSVYKVIEKADLYYQSLVKQCDMPPSLSMLDTKIVTAVINSMRYVDIFPSFGSHSVFYDVKENEFHITLVIRKIVEQYLRIRLFNAGKDYMKNLNVSSRHSMTKIILFNGE